MSASNPSTGIGRPREPQLERIEDTSNARGHRHPDDSGSRYERRSSLSGPQFP